MLYHIVDFYVLPYIYVCSYKCVALTQLSRVLIHVYNCVLPYIYE